MTDSQSIASGFCQCGCGQPTKLAKASDSRIGAVKGQPRRFIHGHSRKGWVPKKGYYAVFDHAVGVSRGAHVLVAERALGHRLPPRSHVHHVDGNGMNNEPSNLVICQDAAYHFLLHIRTRTVRAGGNPNTEQQCSTCGEVKPFSGFSRDAKSQALHLKARCRDCANVIRRKAYQAKLVTR